MPPAQRIAPMTYHPSLRPRSSRGPLRTSAAASTAAVTVHTAEKRLQATPYGRKANSRAHAASRRMNSGVPGGCGMPNDRALAMNSPASQKVTSGASVARYTPSSTAPAIQAPCSAPSLAAPLRARLEARLFRTRSRRDASEHVPKLRRGQVAPESSLHRRRNGGRLLRHDEHERVGLLAEAQRRSVSRT